MTKMKLSLLKTSELTGAALDWAVAKCEGRREPELINNFHVAWYTWGNVHYSTSWSHGGPIIEKFGQEESSFCLFFSPYDHVDYGRNRPWKAEFKGVSFWAETPLIAAMRCYVFSRLGDEVEIPIELQN
jgi:hypothetical protein